MTAAQDRLNEGPVWRRIFGVGAPMTLGILGVLSVGLADAFFLARVGATELAAVGFVYPVIVAVSAFSVGLSAGANATLSQALGAGTAERDVGRMGLHAAALGLGIGLALGGLLWAAAPWLFAALGAEAAVLERILEYLPWWAASFPILMVTMVTNAGFRAAGDGTTPAAMMVATAVGNIALTPVLVFGLGPFAQMGMAGAGIATFTARAIIASAVILLALRRGTLVISSRPFQSAISSMSKTLSTGLPAAAARGVNPAGMAVVTAAVATLGDTAVAGFGAAARVQAIAMVPFFGLSAGLAPVIGQAWGRGDAGRARDAMRVATGFALAYGIGLALLLWAFGDGIARLMANDSGAAAFTGQYLKVVGWSFGAYGVVLAANAAMTARSQARWALGLSLLRIGALYIPAAWAGVMLFGYAGVLGATVLANLLAGWGALIAVRHKALLGRSLRLVEAPSGGLDALHRRRHGEAGHGS
jgi:putative MATE family efflux protein